MTTRTDPPRLPATKREPRGVGIAVVAVLLAVALVAAIWGAGFVLDALGMKALFEEPDAPTKTSAALAAAFEAVEREKAARGRLPTDEEGGAVIDGLRDGWGHALRYRVLDDATYGHGVYYAIRTAGPDGVFDTKDDDGIVYR